MKQALIALLLIFISCQTYNANTFDEDKYGPSDLTGGANFKASYKILQTRCVSCHSYHQEWAGYTDTQDWVNNNLAIDGNPDGSPVIFRLINHGGDMPQGGQALPASEYQTLVDWVTDTSS